MWLQAASVLDLEIIWNCLWAEFCMRELFVKSARASLQVFLVLPPSPAGAVWLHQRQHRAAHIKIKMMQGYREFWIIFIYIVSTSYTFYCDLCPSLIMFDVYSEQLEPAQWRSQSQRPRRPSKTTCVVYLRAVIVFTTSQLRHSSCDVWRVTRAVNGTSRNFTVPREGPTFALTTKDIIIHYMLY